MLFSAVVQKCSPGHASGRWAATDRLQKETRGGQAKSGGALPRQASLRNVAGTGSRPSFRAPDSGSGRPRWRSAEGKDGEAGATYRSKVPSTAESHSVVTFSGSCHRVAPWRSAFALDF